MPAHLVVWYIVFLFSVTFHEYAHARCAAILGDRTAYFAGYLTLDPTPHLKRSPFGLIVIPIITFIQAGWMMGWASVPYDPRWGNRHPIGKAIMSAAGPISNCVLAFLGWTILKVLLLARVVAWAPMPTLDHWVTPIGHGANSALSACCLALTVLVDLNVVLCIFNLMPVPPLDGAGVLEGLAPRRFGPIFDRMRESFLLGTMALLAWWWLFDRVGWPVRVWVANSLT
jgi:Zn-dependent protease